MGEEGRHRSPSRPVVAIGIAVVLVAIVAAIALTRGGAGGGEPPAIEFTVGAAEGVSTVADVADATYDADAARIATSLTTFFSRFYGEAFLTTAGEGEPTYDAALTAFSPEALDAARGRLQVLTLGDLAARFASVAALPGTLRVRVLFDADGAATVAVATVSFRATATPVGGGAPATLASDGSFFLERDASAWRIVAFSVDRSDSGVPAAVAS